ncbi:hypothetical protein CCACVL1_09131 [Corchorus capsularis]|uniref:Rhodanese domain-containing protein n=1 Tax=Corchorus capsularis TaxID=210143 RepID=A0A1R3IXK5_COCAP|nr:hypothetical protein CCACVL1_09131 [Corchorus capsularis]
MAASSSRFARSVIPLVLRPQCLNTRCSLTLVKTPKFQVEQGATRNSFLKYGTIANAEEIEEKGDVKPISVPVKAAYELLQGGHRYLDIRTVEEFKAGHPPSAINIPYYHVFINGSREVKNSKFLEEVSAEFGKEEKFLVGFTQPIDVAGGYTAWKENGLPSTESE